jgi:hypothetical protein
MERASGLPALALPGTVWNPFVWGQPQVVIERFMLLIPFLAGKRAALQQDRVDCFMTDLCDVGEMPLEALRRVRHVDGHHVLTGLLQKYKLGKYTVLSRMLRDISEFPNVLCASRDELADSVSGFGMKSASMFVAFSQPAARVAVLDTHVLRWLGSPAPRSRQQYLDTEAVYLEACGSEHPAVRDFSIWLASQKMELQCRGQAALDAARMMVNNLSING